ncbi:MAG: quinolinate synthase NadA [Myxococcota bacterium]
METFPSLRITADALVPEGSFAEAQAAYLAPDRATVERLDQLLHDKKLGVVAHYYMDPELQGVLSSCSWPHISVSDSLAMADKAIDMVKGGADTIVVLGVDFMSENARAMLDVAGLKDVPVYRVAEEEIGCSLAASAEARAYGAYLAKGARATNPLHVVYINTSLITKAKAHATIPTITCTSSNVVQTVLQAAAQVDDLSVFFGPDTYMGENLESLLSAMASMDDDAIAAVHPSHTRATIESLRKRFHYFEQGNCVVHHLFGEDVVERVKSAYPDAFVTAHLEVPGEMFALGLDRQTNDRGVVGSTADILRFILRKVDEYTGEEGAPEGGTLQFILGTEAGMITPIVRQVQTRLQQAKAGGASFDVEIVFPVASEAVAATSDPSLPIVPGVAGGEGCTTAGGCATCPYMKMNSLDALLALGDSLGGERSLESFEPRKYTEQIQGRSAADLGGEPILHMRAFQQTGALPEALVKDIRSRRVGAQFSASE